MKKFETPTVEVLQIVTENILTSRDMELGGGGSWTPPSNRED